MERKLVPQGRSALTITLPARWLKEKKLRAGDFVSLKEDGNSLVVSTDFKHASESITIDVRNKERSEIYHLILAKYIEGYDKIILKHDNASLMQEITQNLLGMIIEECTPNSAIITTVISIPEDNFNVVLRRATHILVQQANILKEIAEKKAIRTKIKEMERLLDYNLRYCMRYLNKYSNSKESYKYFVLCINLEFVGDLLSQIAKHISGKILISEKIIFVISTYTDSLFSKDFKKIYSALRKFRNELTAKNFVDGLCFSLEELLYDNLAYLITQEDKN